MAERAVGRASNNSGDREMRVRLETSVDPVARRESVRLDILTPAGREEVYFRSPPDVTFDHHVEAAVACCLAPALFSGWDLGVEGNVETGFFDNTQMIQMILSGWNQIDPVKLKVGKKTTGGSPLDPARGVGTFFTGGVDSYASFLEHEEEITHLIYIDDFDLNPRRCEKYQRALRDIEKVARERGKVLWIIETNIREFSRNKLNWLHHYMGSGLASVALLLSSVLKKVYISSSSDLHNLYPLGTHPALDPRWSVSGLEIVHDGLHWTRLEKLRMIAMASWPLETLRVCNSTRGRLNCGRCEKCMRTMTLLRMLGYLDQSPSFEIRLDLKRLSKMKWVEGFLSDSLRWFKLSGRSDPELVAALEKFNLKEQRRRNRKNNHQMRKKLYWKLKGLKGKVPGWVSRRLYLES